MFDVEGLEAYVVFFGWERLLTYGPMDLHVCQVVNFDLAG